MEPDPEAADGLTDSAFERMAEVEGELLDGASEQLPHNPLPPLPPGTFTPDQLRSGEALLADPTDVEFVEIPGDSFGLEEYLLGPKLARTAIGATYRGRRKRSLRPVIIQMISRRFQRQPEVLRLVMAEVGTWVGFEHPHLAGVLDLGATNGRSVVVYDKPAGRPVSLHLAEQGPFQSQEALRVVYDVAQVLGSAQQLDLHHGDLRPETVYFDGAHGVLSDAGLSRASCLAAGFGRLGLGFGHPEYLAPEVVQERILVPTPAADVYALGILFYQLLCGVLPFHGEGHVETLKLHLQGKLAAPPPSLSIHASLGELILRMTAKDPKRRLPDMQAVVVAIQEILEGKPPGEPTSAERPTPGKVDWRQVSLDEGHSARVPSWTLSNIERASSVGPQDLTEPGENKTQTFLIRDLLAGTGEPDESAADGLLLEEKISRGTIGTSYYASYRGEPVVVKALSRKFSRHPTLEQRILATARSAVGLLHPHIVPLRKIVRASDGRSLLVFEQVKGRSLRELLDARGHLSAPLATRLVGQLALALEYAARAGVAHGDIRPEKVLVEGSVGRLTDFGLAEASCLGAGLGRVGLRFGHPSYAAPEIVQERLKQPDSRTDVYALGILFYELVCGQPPFQRASPRETLKLHFQTPLPPPPDSITIPGQVAEVILRMTAKDPARRLGSAQQVREALARFQGVSHTSADAREPEEVDLEGGERVSRDAWDRRTDDLSKHSGEWDMDAILEAPRVGPEEWDEEEDEETENRCNRE